MPGFVGFGAAAEIAVAEMSGEAARLVQLRERLIQGIQAKIANAYVIGQPYYRLPGHICLGFSGREGEAIKLCKQNLRWIAGSHRRVVDRVS